MGVVGVVGVFFTLGTGSLWEGIGGRSLVWGGVATLPLLVVFAAMLRSPWKVLVRLMEMLGTALRTLFAASRPVDILLVSIMAGVGEELLFRGFLYAWFRDLAGPTPALLGSSFLFGMAHFVSPAYAIFAGLAGIYFGWLFEASGDVLTPMIAHGLYDFLAISYYLYGKKRDA